MAAPHLTVRMYNVGFGDAFLIEVPRRPRPYRILVDCGTIKRNGPTIRQVVQSIVQDVTGPGDAAPRIDLVVATHRHEDHILGFEDPAWAAVEVGEVWLPWTEDPDDRGAHAIRERHDRLASLLVDGMDRALRAAGAGAEAAALQAAREVAANSLTNQAAMDTLRYGFSGKPRRRYLPDPGTGRRPLVPKGARGLHLFVLGPSRDPAVVKSLNPPKGESYLAFHEALGGQPTVPQPFGPEWPAATPPVPLDEADRKAIRAFGNGREAATAAALDGAVNGTSLMLVLQVGKAVLLLPGDAQWGTWKAAMAVPEWQALMRRTTFYKVGHHGSHNATPVTFVEDFLPRDFLAMASTMQRGDWPIPKKELMARLAEKGTVVRSDQAAGAPRRHFRVEPGRHVDALIPF